MKSAAYIHSVARDHSDRAIEAHDDKLTQEEVEGIVDQKIDEIDEILVANRDSEVYVNFRASDDDNRPAVEIGSDGLPWFSTSYDSSVFFDRAEFKGSVDMRDDLSVDGSIDSRGSIETKSDVVSERHVKARRGVWATDGYYIKGKMVLNNQLENVAKADQVNTEDILHLVEFLNNQLKKFNDLIDELVEKKLMKP